MLNIAVLVYDLINNYNHTVVDSIYSFFEDKKDVRLIVAPVRTPHREDIIYDYQYWSSLRLLESSFIDGIILVPNSFTSHIDFETLTEDLQKISRKPVVSVARKINFTNSKYTTNTCENAYDLIIKHLKDKHNRKRIGFFDASLIDSPESDARFEAFKKALKNNGLKFYPEIVFHGDFTPGKAEEVIAEKVKSKEELNFDALCCVNDFTCGGCIYHFEKIGVKVPDDVVLVGYDDTDYAIKIFPRLTSINQSIPLAGKKAAELLYKILKKEEPDTKNDFVCIDSFPVYRQSCGCIDLSSFTSAYYDNDGNYFEQNEVYCKAEESSSIEYQKILFDIYNMITMMDCKMSFEALINALKPTMTISNFSKILVCLYENPIDIEKDENYIIPKSAKVQIEYDIRKEDLRLYELGNGEEIFLSETLIPKEDGRFLNGQYFIHPIFIRNLNYGYMLCESESRDYILTAISLKIISDILINAYEYTIVQQNQQSLMEVNENLSQKAKTDELTQILNRRGFMEYGQRLIEMSILSKKMGSVFFCDLDGLKTINDTYGHEIGDLAIKTEAKVLQSAFRDSDLVGRLSGDEFGVVAPGLPELKIEVIRKRLEKLNKKFSEEAKLPFELSISIGQYSIKPEMADLRKLLIKADEKLYEEKKIKHSKK